MSRILGEEIGSAAHELSLKCATVVTWFTIGIVEIPEPGVPARGRESGRGSVRRGEVEQDPRDESRVIRRPEARDRPIPVARTENDGEGRNESQLPEQGC